MKIKHILTLSMLTMSTYASAASLQAYKSQYMNKCANDGETASMCGCGFDAFARSVRPSQQGAAVSFIKSIITETPPARSQMRAIQPMMMAFQRANTQCITGQAQISSPQTTPQNQTMGMGAMGMTAEQLAMIQSMQNGSFSVEKALEMQEKEKQQRAAKEQQRAATEKQQQAQRKQYRKQYDDEMNIIESQSILSQPVSRFKKAFYLKRKSSGMPQTAIDCRWNAVVNTVGTGPAASLTAYFAVLGGGDFDQIPEHKPYMADSQIRFDAYSQAARQCPAY